MPKMKTRRGAAKRFSVTKNGKLRRRKAFKSHLLTSKSPKRKRSLRGPEEVSPADTRRVKRMLGL